MLYIHVVLMKFVHNSSQSTLKLLSIYSSIVLDSHIWICIYSNEHITLKESECVRHKQIFVRGLFYQITNVY